MLELKSSPLSLSFTCPDCNCKLGEAKELFFYGTYIMAECLCECCENNYIHTLPLGHSVMFPVSYSLKTKKAKFETSASWFATPLLEIISKNNSVSQNVIRKVFKENKEIILLNCLDSCYGHIFLKLLNSEKILRENPSKGLVILLPTSFEWLIPKGVSEVWLIEGKLKDFNCKIDGLDSFIKQRITEYTSVVLNDAPVHPDITNIQLENYVKTKPFDLNLFDKKPYQITFILREDRFWTNTKLDAFLMMLSIKMGWMKFMKSYFLQKQNKHIRILAHKIAKKSNQKIIFCAAGIGKSVSLGNKISDYRKLVIDEKGELEWCKLYAESHIVIGIHGSNMLIPTALSAGFIELLPRYKLKHITEDIVMNRKGRYMQFLGRFLDEFSSINLISEHAVSMLNDFPFLKKNTEA